MSDPRKYRSKEEEKQYMDNDPIEQVLKVIHKNKYATEKELEKIQADIKAQVAEAVQFAEDSPFPKVEDMFNDVYEQEDYPFITE